MPKSLGSSRCSGCAPAWGLNALAAGLLVGAVLGYAIYPNVAHSQNVASEPDAVAAAGARFESAFASGEYGRAVFEAERWLAEAEARYGASSGELLMPLAGMASALARAGDSSNANAALGRLTDLVRSSGITDEGRLSAVELARAEVLLSASQPREAWTVLWKERQRLREQKPADRRRELQVSILMLDTAKAAQEVKWGNQAVKFVLSASEKLYGRSSPETLPDLYKAASWYRYSTQMSRERDLLEQAVELIESAYGPKDPRLIWPLHQMASSCLANNSCESLAASALNRAISLSGTTTDQEVVRRAELLATMGDLHVVMREPAESTPYYVEAWRTLASHAAFGASRANEYFGEVRRLYYRPPAEPAVHKGATYITDGHIEVKFTVSPIGTVDDLEAVEIEPKPEMGAATFQAFRRARFRPRIRDGQPAATPDQRFRTIFRVRD